MKIQKSTILSLLALAGIIGLMALLAVELFPLMKEALNDRDNEALLLSTIRSYGAKGVPIIIGLQALQVMVAFFPAVIIQMLAGLAYGVWLGSLLCLVGCVLGNMLVFGALRQFKNTLGGFFKPKPSLKGGKWLDANKIRQMKNPEVMALLLYFIPGMPNGVLPYLFAGTSITFVRFLLCVTLASAPSVLVSAWLGQSLSHKNYLLAALLAGGMVVAVALLLLFRGRLMDKLNAWAEKQPQTKKNDQQAGEEL